MPRLSEGTIVANTVRLAEVSLDESVRVGTRIEKGLLEKFPEEVEHVWTRTGTPEVATDPMGIEVSDVFVALRPREQWKRARTQAELVEAMNAELSDFPGQRVSFTQPIEMRLNELVSGVRSDLGVKLFGDDLDLLKAKAREIEEVLRAIPGAADWLGIPPGPYIAVVWIAVKILLVALVALLGWRAARRRSRAAPPSTGGG